MPFGTFFCALQVMVDVLLSPEHWIAACSEESYEGWRAFAVLAVKFLVSFFYSVKHAQHRIAHCLTASHPATFPGFFARASHPPEPTARPR